MNWIVTEDFLFSRICGQTESPHRVHFGPLKETSLHCALMDPNGFGKGLGNVPRMRGIWPASTQASCPSSASWCLQCRKCLWRCLCLSEEMLFYLNTISISFFRDRRQYYSSCRTGNMHNALSIWFLLMWLGGDTCNLVGSFLADQLPLQVIYNDIMIASV